jgi:hypothetical protein
MSQCRRFTGIVAAFAALFLLSVPAAHASLEPFYHGVGTLKLSVDASGSNSGSGVVQADKPAGATVEKAFLFAASTGFTGFVPPNNEIAIDGTGVAWDPTFTIPNGIQSENVAADVTSIVEPKIEAAAAGRIDFTLTEADPNVMDGEILAVVFNDSTVRTSTVYLLYGAQSTLGDHFSIGLSEALKPSASVTMGLGISYGYQPAGQYSTIDVNKSRLTSSAGGQDDCFEKYAAEPQYGLECGNGTLITAGGIGDSTENPPEPFATDETCLDGLEPAPRCDDELYDLKPFVGPGATSIEVDTLNPSNDDNILLASLDLGSSTAIIGEGVVLGPTGTRTQAGTFHSFTALAQDEEGSPEVGREVTFRVISGPNAGLTHASATGIDGKASFAYRSTVTGTDTVEASFTDDAQVVHTSNDATQTWTTPVAHTFGGEWPYDGKNLTLYYSYEGGHRYLGNVVQGATNWNSAGTKVHIDKWPGAPSVVHIPFVDVNLADQWWGMTIFAESCSTCGYVRNTIMLNQRELDSESDAQRTKVATHEFGHALGLEHPYEVSTSVPSVMWQGLLGGRVRETPQPFDVSRINGMYP